MASLVPKRYLAASRGVFYLLPVKFLFFGYFYLICSSDSTVFTRKEADIKGSDSADVTVSTTAMHSSAFIEDTLFTGSVYKEQSSTESMYDVREVNPDSIVDTNGVQNQPQNTMIDNHDINATKINSANISELANNSTNKTLPFWSCVKYNMTQQSVIIVKDKNDLISWLNELNKTMGCAVVLFYAKWCYFSAKLAPMYNAVGRTFSGIPILAMDAYTHNSLNTRYGIVGVPTIILFQESRPVARFNRSRTFKDLVEFIHQSTGMEYNASIEVSPTDYEEGPLASTPSEEFNFYLFAAVCFLLCMSFIVLWRLQYVEIFVEYFISFTLVHMLVGQTEREKND